MLTTVVTKATNSMVTSTSHVSMGSGLEAFPFANVRTIITINRMVSSNNLYCDDGMNTINLVFCVAIKCPDLYPPQYGEVVVKGYTHGSKAQYSCNKGYKLYGDDYNTCDYGRWIKSTPICKREFYHSFKLHNYSYNNIIMIKFRYNSIHKQHK